MTRIIPAMSDAVSDAVEMSSQARMAALGGTRQLIHEDEFCVLVALLVDCGAVPRNVMAGALQGLAGQMIAKARGEMDTDVRVYPAELFDRARSLQATAATLRGGRGEPGAVRAR
jgi:hypothetical protein